MQRAKRKFFYVLGGVIAALIVISLVTYPQLKQRWTTPLGPGLDLPTLTATSIRSADNQVPATSVVQASNASSQAKVFLRFGRGHRSLDRPRPSHLPTIETTLDNAPRPWVGLADSDSYLDSTGRHPRPGDSREPGQQCLEPGRTLKHTTAHQAGNCHPTHGHPLPHYCRPTVLRRA